MNEDLTPLFLADPDPPSQDVRFRQGTIVTFDQTTLENTVLVGGTVLENLPLLGVGEATTLAAGSVVGIMVVGGAAKSMFITGRIVIPDTADAADAVSLLNSQIYTDYISSLPSGETCTSTTYADLATIGPRVTVPVGPSGRILILASAQIQWVSAVAATTIGDGRFDVEFTGANTRNPDETADPLVGILRDVLAVTAGTGGLALRSSITTQAIFSSLTPGDTTIKMMYRRETDTTQNPVFFRRTLTVFKL